jgi:CBS domain
MTRQTNAIACPPAHTLQPAIADGASVPAGPAPGEARGAPDLTTDRRPSAASSVTVDRYDHVAAAAYLMRHHSVTALAVLDGDRSTRPVGMITKTDITRAAADGEDLNKVRIGQLMSQSPGSDQPQLAQR